MNHLRTWNGSCTAGTVDLNEDLPVSLAKRLSKSVQEAQVTPCQRATAEVIARCRAIRDAEVVDQGTHSCAGHDRKRVLAPRT